MEIIGFKEKREITPEYDSAGRIVNLRPAEFTEIKILIEKESGQVVESHISERDFKEFVLPVLIENSPKP